jgi:RimJ/RimL family protein N-acetyltransferase
MRPAQGLQLRQIDRSLLERCEWKSTIESGCGSLDNFIVYGLGMCLMRGDDIITETYAQFWGLDQVEISVVTNRAYRRRGYATIACAQLIRLCRERGYEPYWSCEAYNIAALNLAGKLEFRGERDYEVRLYREPSE